MVTRGLKYARVGAKAAERSAEWRPGVLRFRKFSKKCEKVAQKRGVPVGHRTFGRRPPPLRAAGEHTVLGGTPPPALQLNNTPNRLGNGASGTDRAEALSAFLRVRPSDARGLSSDKRSRFIVYTVIHAR